MNRLKEKYNNVVTEQLKKEFGYANKFALPKITKVVVNSGIGGITKSKEAIEAAKKELAIITGQMPQIRPAKQSVASFGLRRGMPVGLRITLRNEKMYSFLDRLFSIVLPRLRDFRGVSRNSFDGRGNYTLGIVEHTVFPEIDLAKTQSRGMEITIVMTGGDPKKSLRLLELMGMPFAKK